MLAGKQVFMTRTTAPSFTADDVTRLRTAIGMLARSLRYTDAGAGLTPSELTVLSTIARSGPIGLSELATQQRLNPTMLSRIAGKLCEAGLIERTAAPTDRRAAVVDVTAAGRRRHRAIQAERTESLARHVEALTPADGAALLAALPALEALGVESRERRR
jgi:DNA-binding MarR family transcriptional regulator